jgi:hypothetical protein
MAISPEINPNAKLDGGGGIFTLSLRERLSSRDKKAGSIIELAAGLRRAQSSRKPLPQLKNRIAA